MLFYFQIPYMFVHQPHQLNWMTTMCFEDTDGGTWTQGAR